MFARLQKAQTKKDSGFTLIELLVVIVIIGILAGIAIPLFLNQRQKGVDSGIKSDLKSAATTLETVNVDKPGSGTAYGAADFTSFKKTTGNVIEVSGSPAAGYCVRGSNPGGTAKGGETGTFFWYDSGTGGLNSTPTAAAPAGSVACGGTLSFVAMP